MKSHTRQAKLSEIIMVTLLGVIMYISQVIMASLPNIEIVSLLIILTTRKFGVKALYSVYIFVLCEILTYGISMWIVNYLYVWAILWLVVFLVRRVDGVIVYSLIAAIFGLLFGSFCSVPYFLIGGFSMGIANIISGVWFDLMHCGGNLVLTVILYIPLTKVMEKVIKTS